jgi:hypothetical protein
MPSLAGPRRAAPLRSVKISTLEGGWWTAQNAVARRPEPFATATT